VLLRNKRDTGYMTYLD